MLRELIKQARTEKKWLNCTYQDLWFSPDELEQLNKEGKFLWGPVNWRIADPNENIKYLEFQKEQTEKEIKDFKKRIE